MTWVKTDDRQPDREGEYPVRRASVSKESVWFPDVCAWLPNEPGRRRQKGAWVNIRTGNRVHDVIEWNDCTEEEDT